MSDDVILKIDDKIFSGFESLTINRMLEACADSFSLSCPATMDIKKYFKPFKYQDCKLYIDDELIITGTIDLNAVSLTKDTRVRNIQGRAKTGILADCSIPTSCGYNFNGLTLSEIARRLIAPFGLGLNIFNDTAPFAEANAEPGQTPFDFMSGLAQSTGVLVTSDSQGRLLLINPTSEAPIMSTIIEGDSNMIGASMQADGTSRYSDFTMMLQQDGSNNIQEIGKDSFIEKYRPLIITNAEMDGKNSRNNLAWKKAITLSNSFSVSVEMSGWRHPAGSIYRPAENIILKCPSCDIDKETKLMIAETTFTLSKDQGRTSSFRLVFPTIYSGILPSVMPWD